MAKCVTKSLLTTYTITDMMGAAFAASVSRVAAAIEAVGRMVAASVAATGGAAGDGPEAAAEATAGARAGGPPPRPDNDGPGNATTRRTLLKQGGRGGYYVRFVQWHMRSCVTRTGAEAALPRFDGWRKWAFLAAFALPSSSTDVRGGERRETRLATGPRAGLPSQCEPWGGAIPGWQLT